MKRDNKLKLWYNKKLKDIQGMLPLSENEGRWDIYLLFLFFCNIRPYDTPNNLLEELEERGYDITTLKFSVAKQEGEYENCAKRIGMHFKPDFYEWVWKFKGEGYKIIEFNPSDKRIVFKRKDTELDFHKSKYGNYWYLSTKGKLLLDADIAANLGKFLKFLEVVKMEEIDLERIEEIYN